MAERAHIFGIRHHGPGSARRLVEALDALEPAAVLIEGPADGSDILPMLADSSMVPPVALLAYAQEDATRAAFWPFAEFSPEYQAVRWAIDHGVSPRFIDLPFAWSLAPPVPAEEPADAPAPANAPPVDDMTLRLERDPIGLLAEAGGYEDGESWWRDVIEENPAPGPIFAAVADAMSALRASAPQPQGREAAREAHMRLAISEALKNAGGPVAVVCGAWHVPALTADVSAARDRALLKNAPRVKIAATWAPWTLPRLSFVTGYGAGVASPGWCAHLWASTPEEAAPRWLGRIAAVLRGAGHMASTASLIEAQRLAVALAALRGRPAPGFEELREAAIACLAGGEPRLWDTIAANLLFGDAVGRIPEGAPHAPLIEDLQREQRRTRLKPEALDRELALDLRSDAGLDRSTLLHRLTILGVPWGRLTEAGRSRGTFRERWVLRWEPEYAVALVENLIWGATIEKAAASRLQHRLGEAGSLQAICETTLAALTAQLGDAAHAGVAAIEHRAGETSDCTDLLGALPPLAEILRYGQARRTDGMQLAALFARITVSAALALPFAARGLDDEAAATLRRGLVSADQSIALIQPGGDELAAWRAALSEIVDEDQSTPLIAGVAARLNYEAEALSPEDAAILLGRMLSPGRKPQEAAGFFDGFFEGAGERLIHDDALRQAVDAWVLSLDDETFTAFLPLFRRGFSNLDRMQRRRLLDALFFRRAERTAGRELDPLGVQVWPEHLERLTAILKGTGP